MVWRGAAALLSAGLLASCFHPSQGGEAAYLALVPLIVLSRFSTVRQAFAWGFVSGCVFWAATLVWLLRLCATGGPPFLVSVGWLGLSAYCALYHGAFAAVSAALHARLGLGGDVAQSPLGRASAAARATALVALLPLVWVGLEYARSHLLTGFPWNPLGVSQYRNLAAIQLAEWGGVYAVSALVMALNAGVALTIADVVRPAGGRRRLHPELLLALTVCAAAWIHGAAKVRDLSGRDPGAQVRVAAVQPAVSQLEKWSEISADGVYTQLASQTALALALTPDLLVWPETAVPGALPTDTNALAFAGETARRGVPLLAGALETGADADGSLACWNSSFLFATNGVAIARYRKLHLVPFGEYVPLDRVFPALQRLSPLGVSCLPGDTMTVFRVPAVPAALFSVLICFEDAFADLARLAVLRGARFLVNQTNDAWFDGSAGAMQHMSHCVFRCVENRVAAVRCANTGVTCHIDLTGAVSMLPAPNPSVPAAGFGVYTVACAPLQELTLYTRHGDVVFALPCAVLAAALLAWIAWVALAERRASRRRRIQAPIP